MMQDPSTGRFVPLDISDADRHARRLAQQRAASAKYNASAHGKATRQAYDKTRRAQRLITSRAIYDRNRAYLNELKDVPCMRCGQRHPPSVMEFHHRDRADKEMLVSKLKTCSRARIDREVAKCDIVCANCHRYIELELGVEA